MNVTTRIVIQELALLCFGVEGKFADLSKLKFCFECLHEGAGLPKCENGLARRGRKIVDCAPEM